MLKEKMSKRKRDRERMRGARIDEPVHFSN
jgi:hypothetical protein